MDASTFAGIAASLSSATTVAKAMMGMKIDDEVRDAVSKLQSDLISAQSAALRGLAERAELLERLEAADQKIKGYTNWAEEADKYHLVEFPTGSQVYVRRAEHLNDEPSHKLCPNCFQKGQKSILQSTKGRNGGESVQCLNCDANLKLENYPRPVNNRLSGGHY